MGEACGCGHRRGEATAGFGAGGSARGCTEGAGGPREVDMTSAGEQLAPGLHGRDRSSRTSAGSRPSGRRPAGWTREDVRRGEAAERAERRRGPHSEGRQAWRTTTDMANDDRGARLGGGRWVGRGSGVTVRHARAERPQAWAACVPGTAKAPAPRNGGLRGLPCGVRGLSRAGCRRCPGGRRGGRPGSARSGSDRAARRPGTRYRGPVRRSASAHRPHRRAGGPPAPRTRTA